MNEYIAECILIVCGFGVLICQMMLVRNSIVHEARIRANEEWYHNAEQWRATVFHMPYKDFEQYKQRLDRGSIFLEEFKKLDSYNTMLFKIACWNYKSLTNDFKTHIDKIYSQMYQTILTETNDGTSKG